MCLCQKDFALCFAQRKALKTLVRALPTVRGKSARTHVTAYPMYRSSAVVIIAIASSLGLYAPPSLAIPGERVETSLQNFKQNPWFRDAVFMSVPSLDAYKTQIINPSQALDLWILQPRIGDRDHSERIQLDNFPLWAELEALDFNPRQSKAMLEILTAVWGPTLSQDFANSRYTATGTRSYLNKDEVFRRENLYRGSQFGYQLTVESLRNQPVIEFTVYSLQDWTFLRPEQEEPRVPNSIDKLGLTSTEAFHSPDLWQRAGTHAFFQGEMWVTGTLNVVRTEYFNPPRTEWQFILVPDDLSTLPQFSHRLYDIHIKNSQIFAKTEFGQDITTQLATNTVHKAQVHGRFLLTNFELTVICDSAIASADVLTVDVPIAETIVFDSQKMRAGC
jgi:hypothetical protein